MYLHILFGRCKYYISNSVYYIGTDYINYSNYIDGARWFKLTVSLTCNRGFTIPSILLYFIITYVIFSIFSMLNIIHTDTFLMCSKENVDF